MIRVNSQKGMSLIEILVVLAIIGTIAATVGSSVFGNKEKAKLRIAKIQISKVENAINTFYNDCDQLPDSLEQLLTEPGAEVCESWGPGAYTKQKDLIDPWKNDFVYEQTSEGFKVMSYGKGGQEGGEGLEKDISSEDL